MSHSASVRTKTFRFTRSTTTTSSSSCINGGYMVSASGVAQISETVLGAVCVGLMGYYGNKYFYDVGAQASEFINLWLNHKQMDVWKPVICFLLVSTACLFNTLCLLISSVVSFNTASMISKTIYGIIYHLLAFALYISASIALILAVGKQEIKGYRDGYYYDPFLAAGIIGTIISAFYLLSTILSYLSYRGNV